MGLPRQDLMWYRVDETAPRFRFSRHRSARASGGSFGSTCVDRRFLEFLSERLDDSDYIAQAGEQHFGGGGHFIIQRGQQILLEQFITAKHAFKGPHESPDDNLLDLPEGLIGDTRSRDPDIRSGKLRISWYDAPAPRRPWSVTTDET